MTLKDLPEEAQRIIHSAKYDAAKGNYQVYNEYMQMVRGICLHPSQYQFMSIRLAKELKL